jgi:hypothetical protein
MRSYWTADIMPNADVVQVKPGMVITKDYDVYIWMKTGELAIMEKIREFGKMQFIEVCDPNWWQQPDLMRKMIDNMTALVAATEPARDDLLKWYGTEKRCYIVPDRLNMAHFPKQRGHQHADPVRFIWYGVSINRGTLIGAIPVLERLKAAGVNVELTILDNSPEIPLGMSKMFPIYHTRWTLESENEIISAHDIALLPPYPGPWGKLKSNNKTLTAWACGLPVTDGFDYYDVYNLATNSRERAERAKVGWLKLNMGYLIEHTAEQWKHIINQEMEYV